MLISIIAALDQERVIGAGNRLPWRLPADLRRFRRITMGKPIVMGRRTHESIGRALDGRRNLVLSRDPGTRAPGCEVLPSLDAALAAAGDSDEVVVIGGATVYAEALPRADRMYLTRIRGRFAGDAWFPELDPADWVEVAREEHPAVEDGDLDHAFVVLERAGRQARAGAG